MRILHRKFPFRPPDNSLFGRHLTRKILLCFFGYDYYTKIRAVLQGRQSSRPARIKRSCNTEYVAAGPKD
jgi:hypothetical protein